MFEVTYLHTMLLTIIETRSLHMVEKSQTNVYLYIHMYVYSCQKFAVDLQRTLYEVTR